MTRLRFLWFMLSAFVAPARAYVLIPVLSTGSSGSSQYTPRHIVGDACLAARPQRRTTRHCKRRNTSGPRVFMSSSEAAAAASPPPPDTPRRLVPEAQTTIVDGTKISKQWELDVYSRPVVGADGKKLWELLMCDSTGNFRHVAPIPSNMVNSREVRKTIEAIIELAPEEARPITIRFFRNAMFNMIDIALRGIDVAVKPCRTTYAMYQWLEERERDVYPSMEGFKPTMKAPAFDIRVSGWYG